MFVLYLSKQGLSNFLQQSSLTYHRLEQTSFLLLRKFPRNLFLPSGFYWSRDCLKMNILLSCS